MLTLLSKLRSCRFLLFLQVFDGHGGIDATLFIKNKILNYIVEDSNIPTSIKKTVKNAFVKADHAILNASSLDSSSGTTTLTALITRMLEIVILHSYLSLLIVTWFWCFQTLIDHWSWYNIRGYFYFYDVLFIAIICLTHKCYRTMLIANAGDSRAVLGKWGRVIELSKDHKPNCTAERLRIEKLGDVIYDGYLNGQLSLARALGDWHIKGSKVSKSPLSSKPELEEILLSEEDEFLIIGCDGLWDVISNQCAVTMVRKELIMHNDPGRCLSALVKEALQCNTCDNCTVVVVCFSSDPPPKIEIPRSQKRRSISAEGLDLLKGVLNDLWTLFYDSLYRPNWSVCILWWGIFFSCVLVLPFVVARYCWLLSTIILYIWELTCFLITWILELIICTIEKSLVLEWARGNNGQCSSFRSFTHIYI